MARIDDAVARILRAKARLGLHESSAINLAALPQTFGRPEFARAAQDIADRGITLLRDVPRLLPLDATEPAGHYWWPSQAIRTPARARISSGKFAGASIF